MWRLTWQTSLKRIRDLAGIGIGAWGVIHEEISAHPDLSRMMFFGALMIAPATFHAWLLGRGNGDGSSSAPPSPPSSPSSLSPSLEVDET